MTRRSARLLCLLAVAVLAAGCGVTPASQRPDRTVLTVGLGYIPSVQFAPFYLADQSGAYRDAGLDVTFQNKIDPDLVTLVGQGTIDVGLADGTSLIPAVSQGIPVQYVATIYRDFPSVIFSATASGIASAADLQGRKIGIPGRYGSSWIMLQAILGSAGLTPDDVQVLEYPTFGQGAALQQGAVDAATGFVNNEPVQLELAGISVTTLHVDGIVPLPGPGLISGATTLSSKAAAIRAFIEVTLRTMDEIALDPAKGLDAAIAAVPELGKDRATQEAILRATVAAWKGSGSNPATLGSIDPADWTASLAFLSKLGLVAAPVTVDQLLRTDLLPN